MDDLDSFSGVVDALVNFQRKGMEEAHVTFDERWSMVVDTGIAHIQQPCPTCGTIIKRCIRCEVERHLVALCYKCHMREYPNAKCISCNQRRHAPNDTCTAGITDPCTCTHDMSE